MLAEPFALIYIHGFNSSPKAYKANLLLDFLRTRHREVRFCAPELPFDPQRAMQLLDTLICQLMTEFGARRVGLVGSSLGGYYGAYFAERYGVPMVLVNPSVEPYVTLTRYLGENVNVHTGERYCLTAQHAEVLKTYQVEALSRPEDYLLMVQTADETLDYRKAVAKYCYCRQIIETGGNHGFDGFANYFDELIGFLLKRKVTQ